MLDEKDLEAIAALIDARLDAKLDAKLAPINERLDRIEGTLDEHTTTLDALKESMAGGQKTVILSEDSPIAGIFYGNY